MTMKINHKDILEEHERNSKSLLKLVSREEVERWREDKGKRDKIMEGREGKRDKIRVRKDDEEIIESLRC
jgi:hypothetical protein